jgi:cytochrome c5
MRGLQLSRRQSALTRALALVAALVGYVACSASPRDDAPSDASEAFRYVNDEAYRRAALEESLTTRANTYAARRLLHFAGGDHAWDVLPVYNPRTAALTTADVASLQAGHALSLDDGRALADALPIAGGDATLVALGRDAFLTMPLKPDADLLATLASPSARAESGLVADASGAYVGIRKVPLDDGSIGVAMTCATCHADVIDGATVLGRARRAIHIGAIRMAPYRGTGFEAEASRVLRSWGAQREDVTDDGRANPVRIPDIDVARWQRHFDATGTLRNNGFGTLAMRTETLVISGSGATWRPSHVLAAAIAAFVRSLAPAPRELSKLRELPQSAGADVFRARCAACHDPARGFASDAMIPVADVGTDPAVGASEDRGTGFYRAPSLIGIGTRAPYLHDASAKSLDDVLAPGLRGHPFAPDLSDDERRALLALLSQL